MAHPQTLATQVETLRVNLLSMSDSLRSIRTALQIPLVTVMGRQEVLGAGLLKAAARKALCRSNKPWIDRAATADDPLLMLQATSDLMRQATDMRAAAVAAGATNVVVDYIKANVDDDLDSSILAVQQAMQQLKSISIAASTATNAMNPDRLLAQQQFDSSIQVVITAVYTIESIEQQIDQVQTELNTRFDSSNIAGTAADPVRAQLSVLESQLRQQRDHCER